MARFTPRLTAGVGVLVAFLLLGGSATVAVADPGRSHSDRGNSSDRGNDGIGNSRGGSDRGDDYRRGNDNSRKRGEDDGDGSAERGSVESPEVQFGSGPDDLADVAELAPSLAAGKSGDGDGTPIRDRAVSTSPMSQSWRQASPPTRANCVRVDPTRAYSEESAQRAHPIGPALIGPMSRRHGSVYRA